MIIRAINRYARVLFFAALPVCGSAAQDTLRFLETRVKADPLDFTAQNRLADIYIKTMRESGDLSYLGRAAQAARASVNAVSGERNPGGLAALALVEYESHHFTEALKLAQQAYRIDPRNPSALATTGDAYLELGDYKEAEIIYQKLAKNDNTAPPILARLARLAELHGDNQKAIELLEKASKVDAWFLLRLGEIYFRTGKLAQAENQYQTALKQQPDSVFVLEHLAELRAAQTHYDEAIELYQKVIARVPRAEFLQALGDLYVFMGKPEAAKPWYERTLAAYLQSNEQGNAHYWHHLTNFYSDVEENPVAALYWANKDRAVRHSIYAYDALAWAYYKNDNMAKAKDTIKKALALGTQDAHLFFHAGLIYSRAGEMQLGQSYLKQTVAINPAYNAFHTHR